MDEINVGAIGAGASVSRSAIGHGATVVNTDGSGPPRTADEFRASLDRLRRSLDAADPDLRLQDALAALVWLRTHLESRTVPPDGPERLQALRRSRRVWAPLWEMTKQLPSGVIAGWIVEGMKALAS